MELEILASALVSAFSGVFDAFRYPVSQYPPPPHPPNLPIPYTGYNSDANETAETRRPREQRGAHGRRRDLDISATALVSALTGVLGAFWFPVFQNPPSPNSQNPIENKIPNLTKTPRPRGHGSRRSPTEARKFTSRPVIRVSRCFLAPFGFPFSNPLITNILYRI